MGPVRITLPWHRHVVLVIAQLIVGLGLVVTAAISDVSTIGRVIGIVLALLVTVALLAWTASDRVVRRGLATLVGGLCGVCVGAAIGPVWLATTGPSLVAVSGLAMLAAGLVLLASGAWLLIRATPGWWRLAAIPVAFVLLQFVVLPVAGAVYGTHPPPTPVDAAMPPSAERVSFETPDGVTMVSWYTPSTNGAAVIVLPGSGGSKDSTLAHAGILTEHGYGVLALDSRGTGDSGGLGNAWGWHGVADVRGAVDWLGTRPEVDPERIAALGLSMGGEVALTAAASGTGLAAVVAEGASSRVPADLVYLPADVSGLIQRLDGEIMWALAGMMTDAAPPISLTEAVAAAAAAEVPLLLIVGQATDEVLASRYFRSAAPSMEVWELPDTPHIESLARHPDEWETRVMGFLESALGAM
jgi:dienelactone hydrolase